MTQRWAYIGELGKGGVLDWGGDGAIGNIPTGGRLRDLDSTAFWKIMDYAQKGAYDGRQVDWGAWALKVNGPQLREVLVAAYGGRVLKEPWPPLDSYLALADELGADNYMALVAAEL